MIEGRLKVILQLQVSSHDCELTFIVLVLMSLSPQSTGILTSEAPYHLLVDQSCFKSFTGLRSGSLKCAPAREFAEEIHDYREHCKYQYVNQAMAKAYPWNKQTLVLICRILS